MSDIHYITSTLYWSNSTNKAFPFAIPIVQVSNFFFFWKRGKVLQGVGTPCKPECSVHHLIDNFSHFFSSCDLRCTETAPYSIYSDNTCDSRFIFLAQTMKFRHLLTTQDWTRKFKKILGYQTRQQSKEKAKSSNWFTIGKQDEGMVCRKLKKVRS